MKTKQMGWQRKKEGWHLVSQEDKFCCSYLLLSEKENTRDTLGFNQLYCM